MYIAVTPDYFYESLFNSYYIYRLEIARGHAHQITLKTKPTFLIIFMIHK